MPVLRLFPALLLLGSLLGGCEPPTSTDDIEPPRDLSVSEQEVLSSSQHFGLDLFRALHEEAPEENLFLSPLSASMALGMTLNGAEGETYEAMQETLALSGLSEAEVNEAYRELLDLLVGLDPSVRFSIANSIWHRDSFPVEEDFLETGREYFGAEIEALDFSSEEAPGIINAWVEEQTEGRIEEIIGEIDPLTMMYLINAIYFKADWRYPFDPEDTEPAPFTRLDGSEVEVDMMRQEETFPFLSAEHFQAVDLPYGDSLYSMTVILPDEDAGVNEIMDELDGASWEEWTEDFAPRNIQLALPAFTLEWERSLNDVLTAMGMEPAFDPAQSNFSGINPEAEDLHISDVKQKTFLEVDEEGTEAAAATSVEVGVTSAPPAFRVDRPFILAIRERHSGTLLFIGKILDPTA